MSLILTLISPARQIITAVELTVVQLSVSVLDNDAISRKWVRLSVDWGDGSAVVQRSNTANASGLTFTEEHRYLPGTYTIAISASNFKYPAPEEQALSIGVFVSSSTGVTDPTLFGPILPLDEGHPNKEEWALDRGEDLKVLVSSVKMLCLTARGERLMRPTYGTGLRAALFNNIGTASDSDSDLVDQLSADVTQALATHEPRVSLRGLTVRREGRSVYMDLTCSSVLTSRVFPVNLEF